ncbi:MAG: type II secretion system protein GspL, partial [bacterium]
MLDLLGFFQSQGFLSVDFSGSAVKIARADVQDNALSLKMTDKEPVHNLNDKNKVEKYSEALGTLIMRNSISSNDNVVFSLPTNSVIVRHVELPSMPDQRLSEVIQYEAESHIPFPIDDVILDYHVLEQTDEGTRVLLVVVKNEKLDKYLDVLNNVELRPKTVDISAFSLFNLYQKLKPDPTARNDNGESSQSKVLVDIGYANTDIIIFQGETLYYARSASVAGQSITKEISEEMDLEIDEAEDLKINYGNLPLADAESEKEGDKPDEPPASPGSQTSEAAPQSYPESEQGDDSGPGLTLNGSSEAEQTEQEISGDAGESDEMDVPSPSSDPAQDQLNDPEDGGDSSEEIPSPGDELKPPDPPKPESIPESADSSEEDSSPEESMKQSDPEPEPPDTETNLTEKPPGPDEPSIDKEQSEESDDEDRSASMEVPQPPESDTEPPEEEEQASSVSETSDDTGEPLRPDFLDDAEEEGSEDEQDEIGKPSAESSGETGKREGGSNTDKQSETQAEETGQTTEDSEGSDTLDLSLESTPEAESESPSDPEETSDSQEETEDTGRFSGRIEKEEGSETLTDPDEELTGEPSGPKLSASESDDTLDSTESDETLSQDAMPPSEVSSDQEEEPDGTQSSPELSDFDHGPDTEGSPENKDTTEEVDNQQGDQEPDEESEDVDDDEDEEHGDLSLGELRTPDEDKDESDGKDFGVGAAANPEEPDPPSADYDEERLKAVIRSQVDRLINELQQTFDYYQNEMDGTDVGEIILCGSGSKIKNLPEYVAQELDRDAHRFDPLAKLKGLGVEELQSMLVAVGLQLRSKPASSALEINLMPQEILQQRQASERNQKLIANGALVGLLLLQLLVYMFYAYRVRKSNYEISKKQLQKVQPIVDRVKRLNQNKENFNKRISIIND